MRLALTLAAAFSLTACGGPADPTTDPAGFVSDALCANARQLEGVSTITVETDRYDADVQVAAGDVPTLTVAVTPDGTAMPPELLQIAAAGSLYGVVTIGGPPDVHPCQGAFPADAFVHEGTETVAGTIGHAFSGFGGRFVVDPQTFDLLRYETGDGDARIVTEWSAFQDAGGVRYPHTVSIVAEGLDAGMTDEDRAQIELSLMAQDALAEMGELPDSLAAQQEFLRPMLAGEPIRLDVQASSVRAVPAGG